MKKLSKILDMPMVCVDIETTGGSVRFDRVIEVAAIRSEKGKIVDVYKTFINPERSIPPEITQLTGIRVEDLTNAPLFQTVARDVEKITKDALFIAHNARFDWSFLRAEFGFAEMEFSPKTLCTRSRYSRHRY
jgi:DNA polymerase III subunit epsilon